MSSAKEIESTERLLRVIRDGVAPTEPGAGTTNTPLAGLPDFVALPEKKADAPALPVLSNGKKLCLAVGIGKQAIHCALTSHQRGQPVFQDLRSFPYPPDLTLDGPAFPAFLNLCIRKVAPRAKFDVWTFISIDLVEYSFAKLPNVSAKDLRQALLWTVKKEKKFNEQTQVFDHRVLGRIMDKGVEKRLVVYFLAPISEVEKLQGLFRQAGFALNGISTPPLAIQNFFSTQWLMESKNVVAHLWLGNNSSRIDIFDQGRLLFARNIKVGANSFIEAIRDSLSPSPSPSPSPLEIEPVPEVGTAPASGQARDLRRLDARALFLAGIEAGQAKAVPFEPRDPSPENLLEMFKPALGRLIRQLELTLEYHVNNLGFQSVQKILVSGPPVLFPGLLEHVAGQFSIPVALLDPAFIHNSELSRRTRMELLPVAGLALSDNERTINALHTHVHRAQEKMESLISMAAGVFVVLILVAVFGGYAHTSSTLQDVNAHIRMQEEKLQVLEAFPDTQGLLSLFADAQERDDMIKRYLERYKPVAAMSALTFITPSWVRLQSVSFPLYETGEGFIKGLITGPMETLDAYLGSYIMMLGDSDVFSSPRLISKSRANGSLEFHINLKARGKM